MVPDHALCFEWGMPAGMDYLLKRSQRLHSSLYESGKVPRRQGTEAGDTARGDLGPVAPCHRTPGIMSSRPVTIEIVIVNHSAKRSVMMPNERFRKRRAAGNPSGLRRAIAATQRMLERAQRVASWPPVQLRPPCCFSIRTTPPDARQPRKHLERGQ